jgi:predicted permease
MTTPRGPRRWLHAIGLGKPRPDESATLEVDHHLAELTDRLVAEGLSAENARREAVRHFGDRARYAAKMRKLEERSLREDRWNAAFHLVRQSLVSVARTARREPGFTAAVVLTLGLGIGANATMYGIIDRLLLSPPEHIVEPDELRRVEVFRPSVLTGELRRQSLAYPDYADFHVHGGMVVAGYDFGREVTLGGGETATRARVVTATAEIFPLLGVQPRLGRFYTEEESAFGAPLTAVVSEELWRRLYGADPDVLGRTIDVDGRQATIVGVAPNGFTGVNLQPVDIWLPLEAARSPGGVPDSCLTGRNCYWMTAVGRIRDGVSVEAAEAEATRLHRNGRGADYPATAAVRLTPLMAAAGPNASAESRVAGWLAGVSSIVLLIACANVANLLLARSTRTRRETSVRLALGVSRSRIVGQTMLEAVVLAFAGGLVGLALVHWGGSSVRSTLLPGVSFPRGTLDGAIVLFAGVVSLLAGAVAGLAPAIMASRLDVRGDLVGSSRTHTGARSRLRGFLTVSQAAMSVVLLVGAGLFVASLRELRSLDLGIDVTRLTVVEMEFTSSQPPPSLRWDVFDLAKRRIQALPGVEAVAATATPFTVVYAVELRVPELDSIPMLPGGGPYLFSVSPDYFETAGLSIIQGRALNEGDAPGTEKVAVVSETMARVFWPDQRALGRCLLVAVGARPDECATVVGVVEDATRGGYSDPSHAAYYLTMAQIGEGLAQGRVATGGDANGGTTGYFSAPRALYVRASADADDLEAAIARALRPMPPGVRWIDVWPMYEPLDQRARSWILGATMFTIFGLLALAVAAVGLYSVLAFDVAQRTREIGVRTALGARTARLLGLVVSRGVLLGGIGVALGLAVAYLVAPYIQDLLFETSPRDPSIFVGVAIVLLTVSVAASLAPALRATRVDPVTALRAE